MLFPCRVIGIARSFSAADGRVHTGMPATSSPGPLEVRHGNPDVLYFVVVVAVCPPGK